MMVFFSIIVFIVYAIIVYISIPRTGQVLSNTAKLSLKLKTKLLQNDP